MWHKPHARLQRAGLWSSSACCFRVHRCVACILCITLACEANSYDDATLLLGLQSCASRTTAKARRPPEHNGQQSATGWRLREGRQGAQPLEGQVLAARTLQMQPADLGRASRTAPLPQGQTAADCSCSGSMYAAACRTLLAMWCQTSISLLAVRGSGPAASFAWSRAVRTHAVAAAFVSREIWVRASCAQLWHAEHTALLLALPGK